MNTQKLQEGLRADKRAKGFALRDNGVVFSDSVQIANGYMRYELASSMGAPAS